MKSFKYLVFFSIFFLAVISLSINPGYAGSFDADLDGNMVMESYTFQVQKLLNVFHQDTTLALWQL